jgi:hypothetical protein
MKKQLQFSFRRLGRHKLTTGINLLGLTFGILACVVIYLYVSFELTVMSNSLPLTVSRPRTMA